LKIIEFDLKIEKKNSFLINIIFEKINYFDYELDYIYVKQL